MDEAECAATIRTFLDALGPQVVEAPKSEVPLPHAEEKVLTTVEAPSFVVPPTHAEEKVNITVEAPMSEVPLTHAEEKVITVEVLMSEVPHTHAEEQMRKQKLSTRLMTSSAVLARSLTCKYKYTRTASTAAGRPQLSGGGEGAAVVSAYISVAG